MHRYPPQAQPPPALQSLSRPGPPSLSPTTFNNMAPKNTMGMPYASPLVPQATQHPGQVSTSPAAPPFSSQGGSSKRLHAAAVTVSQARKKFQAELLAFLCLFFFFFSLTNAAFFFLQGCAGYKIERHESSSSYAHGGTTASPSPEGCISHAKYIHASCCSPSGRESAGVPPRCSTPFEYLYEPGRTSGCCICATTTCRAR